MSWINCAAKKIVLSQLPLKGRGNNGMGNTYIKTNTEYVPDILYVYINCFSQSSKSQANDDVGLTQEPIVGWLGGDIRPEFKISFSDL